MAHADAARAITPVLGAVAVDDVADGPHEDGVFRVPAAQVLVRVDRLGATAEPGVEALLVHYARKIIKNSTSMGTV